MRLVLLSLFVMLGFNVQAVEFNLPEKFEAKLYKWKIDGKIYNNVDDGKTPKSCKTISFQNGHFYLPCEYTTEHSFPKGATVRIKWQSISKGVLKERFIQGTYYDVQRNWNFNHPPYNGEYMRTFHEANLNGNILDDGTIMITMTYTREDIYDRFKTLARSDGTYYSHDYGSPIVLRDQEKTMIGKEVIAYYRITDFTQQTDIEKKLTQIFNAYKEIDTETKAEMSKLTPVTLPTQPPKLTPTKTPPVENTPPPLPDTSTLPEEETYQEKETNAEEQVREENIKYYQDIIEIERQMKQRAQAKLNSLKERNADGRFDYAITSAQQSIHSYTSRIKNNKAQLKALGATTKTHIKRDNRDVYEDTAIQDKTISSIKKNKDISRSLEQSHKIIEHFGEEYEDKKGSHKVVERFSQRDKDGNYKIDPNTAKRIRKALKKQHYESKQTKQEAQTVYQLEKDKELTKKKKYLNTLKDTSLQANKVLAKLDPTGTRDKIVDAQEKIYVSIEGFGEGGLQGAASAVVMSKADEVTNDWASEVKESTQEYVKYYKDDIELTENEYYYDKEGKRLKRVNIRTKVYNKKGEEITFSFKNRILRKAAKKIDENHNIVEKVTKTARDITDGMVSGDYNKALGGVIDAVELKDEIGSNEEDNDNKKKDQTDQ